MATPAEPFSRTWLESSGEPPPRKQVRWTNTDACPEPWSTGPEAGDDLTQEALGPADDSQLATFLVHPSFHPPRSLALLQRADGGYTLRSTTITRPKWKALTAAEASCDRETCSALRPTRAELSAARLVAETEIDPDTARLLIRTWIALLGRRQVVREINPRFITLDGTSYSFWRFGAGAWTHAPEHGSALADAVLAAEHLERLVSHTSVDEVAELQVARDYLREALERTSQREPCLRREVDP